MTETAEYRMKRATQVVRLYTDSCTGAPDPTSFAAIALFTGEQTDRALAGWVPHLWSSQPRPG